VRNPIDRFVFGALAEQGLQPSAEADRRTLIRRVSLDLARFADSVGYHGDQLENNFPYREYVIGAFNQNKRFDQFTSEQLAGDLLPYGPAFVIAGVLHPLALVVILATVGRIGPLPLEHPA